MQKTQQTLQEKRQQQPPGDLSRSETDQGYPQQWWILISVGVGTFMAALDGSVVNTVLPVIREHFGSDVAAIQWVVVIYLLVISGLLLTFGRLGDLYGHKPVYLTGFVVFTVASALCGLATSTAALIAGRGIQALGASMLMANSPAILTKSFPPRQRGQALGIQATMTYLGLTVGPSLGGWLAFQFSWRAVFYINLPVGLLAILLGMRFIPSHLAGDRADGHKEPFDLSGAVTFMAGLVALLLGLNRGHDWGWTSPVIVGLLLAAAMLLSLFIFLQLRKPAPMLDLSLFKNTVFSTSVFSALLNYMAVYSIIFLMPFYLIQGLGLDSARAGLLLTAQPLVMAVVAPVSGTLSDRFGVRIPTTLGMLILSIALFLLSGLGPQSPLLHTAAFLALAGLGIGIFVSPNNSALMGSAPRHRQGIAAGVLATARNVGMVLGVGMSGAVLSTVLAQSANQELFTAIRIGFILAAVLAIVGGLASALRSQEPTHQ